MHRFKMRIITRLPSAIGHSLSAFRGGGSGIPRRWEGDSNNDIYDHWVSPWPQGNGGPGFADGGPMHDFPAVRPREAPGKFHLRLGLMNLAARPSFLPDPDPARLEGELKHAKVTRGGLGDLTIANWTAPAGKRVRSAALVQQTNRREAENE